MSQLPPKSNPYGSPMSYGNQGAGGPGYTSPGLVGNIMPLSICMIVLGSLEILFGIFFIVMSIFMPQFLAMQQQAGGNQGMDPQQVAAMQQTIGWITVIYGGMGLVGLVVGFLRLVAGILGLRGKGRKLAIASHIIGLGSCFLCYCIPTSVGICIWGCIVHFNEGVKRKFDAQQSS